MYSLKRNWMYRSQRPNWVARIANRIWEFIASSGIMPNYAVTLEVIGRKSGRVVTFPVVLALVDGRRYLVSMLGDEAQWVQNVRAAKGKAFIRCGGRREVFLEEVPVDQRPPVLKAYLQRANGARPHIPVHKDAPIAEFASIAASYPCFQILAPQTSQQNMQPS